MAKEEARQKEYHSILENLLKDPANKKCADCGAAAPRWASASLGIFICMRCAGIHRNVGVHITFVRSVSLDKWTEEHVQNMVNTGNARAAEMYEARIPAGYPRPNSSDNAAIEKWIRDKYERKRFLGAPGTKPAQASRPQQQQAQEEFTAFVKPTVPATPQPAAPAVGSLLISSPPQVQQPQVQQAPPQQPQQQPQQVQQPQQPLQAIKILTADEQAAVKKANVLQIFEQQQQQQQQQQQLQQQQQQALYAAYAAQAAYMQQQQFGQPVFYGAPGMGQPGVYAYPQYAYGGVPATGIPIAAGIPATGAQADPLLQKINTMGHEKRQSEFGTLFG